MENVAAAPEQFGKLEGGPGSVDISDVEVFASGLPSSCYGIAGPSWCFGRRRDGQLANGRWGSNRRFQVAPVSSGVGGVRDESLGREASYQSTSQ